MPIQVGHVTDLVSNLADLYHVRHAQLLSFVLVQRLASGAQFEVRWGDPVREVEPLSQDDAVHGGGDVGELVDGEEAEGSKIPHRGYR